MAEDGEAPDTAKPKASGITVVPVHPRSPLKTTAPVKKEKPVSDETGSMPPGLAKKGELPKGLQKKDKTPSGWEKGKKLGWEKDKSDEKRESIFERKAREKLEKEQSKKDKKSR